MANPSTVRTGPLGQVGEALGDSLQGFLLADALTEQNKARNAKTIASGIKAFQSGNTKLAFSLFRSAGPQGRAIEDHFFAGPEGSDVPLDDVSGDALDLLFNVKQGRELAIEELIARGPSEGAPSGVLIGDKVSRVPNLKGAARRGVDTSLQGQVKTRAGREDAGIEGFISGDTSARANLLRSIQGTQDVEITKARATAQEGRAVETAERAQRGEVAALRAEERAKQGLEFERQRGANAKRRLEFEIFSKNEDKKLAAEAAKLKEGQATGVAIDGNTKSALESIKRSRLRTTAGIESPPNPLQNITLNKLTAIERAFPFVSGPTTSETVRAQRTGPVRSEAQESIVQGGVTPRMASQIRLANPANAENLIEMFNIQIESIQTTILANSALADKRGMQDITNELTAIRALDPDQRAAAVPRLLELMRGITGLPADQLQPGTTVWTQLVNFFSRNAVSLQSGQVVAAFVEATVGPTRRTKELIPKAKPLPPPRAQQTPEEAEAIRAKFLAKGAKVKGATPKAAAQAPSAASQLALDTAASFASD